VTHYEVLGVPSTATAEEIKRAYRLQARRHHPDVSGADDATMQTLNQAWATLGDPVRRQAYDRTFGIGRTNGSRTRGAGAGASAGAGSGSGWGARPQPEPPPIVVDEDGEANWGPEPEPGPGTARDLWLLVPVGLLGCAALSVGLGALLYAPVFLGLAAFFVAVAVFAFALVPILTLRRQARRTYR